MKKVQKKELMELIARYYKLFMDQDVGTMNSILSGRGNVKIEINSIFISVRKYRRRLNQEIEDEKIQERLNKFTTELEKISLGNLKVVNFEISELESTMDIACGYEIMD